MSQNKLDQITLAKMFFENIIEFDTMVELRIFRINEGVKKPYVFSHWVSNFEELLKAIKLYEGKQYVCYFGINSRDVQSRKAKDIKWRRCFYFDIENRGEKPQFTDTAYFNQLSVTVKYITAFLKAKYQFRPCALIKTGRGLALYYAIRKLPAEQYKNQFRTWYKRMQEEILKKGTEDKILPAEIKWSDSVFDSARIGALPLTRKHKYPESPIVRILDYKYHINDLQSILDAIKDVPYNLHADKINEIKLNVDEKTVLEKCPELKLLMDFNTLPEGELHNKIIFAVKLFVRDSKINPQIVQKMITQCGYSDVIDSPTEEYCYSQNIFINWCLDNHTWSLKNQYRCPFTPFPLRKKVEGCRFEEKKNLEFEKRTLITFRDVCTYARDFNKKFKERVGGHRIVYAEDLKSLLKENIVNKDLYDYLEFMGYIDKICLLEWSEKKEGVTIVEGGGGGG